MRTISSPFPSTRLSASVETAYSAVLPPAANVTTASGRVGLSRARVSAGMIFVCPPDIGADRRLGTRVAGPDQGDDRVASSTTLSASALMEESSTLSSIPTGPAAGA